MNIQNSQVEKSKELPSEEFIDQQETASVEEVMEKYDAASSYRKNMKTFWKWLIFLASVLLSLFQLYTAIFGTLPSNQQRGFHVAFALGLIYLLYPGNKRQKVNVSWLNWTTTGLFLAVVVYLYYQGEIRIGTLAAFAVVIILLQLANYYNKEYPHIPLPDILLAFLGFSAAMYQFFFYQGIIARVGMYNSLDFIIAAIGVVVVLGAARRVVGVPIVVVAIAMLTYAYLGPVMPGFLQHRGFSAERIISHSFLSMEGIFGIPIAISATFIYLYMMFGVILQKTGLEEFFTDLAMSMTGWMVGGTAKVGILTSVFSGMITGSSVANTVGNGAFTIPMMKRAGYRPEFAAAVEAASSTGGQIMPPIMGSAAFLMIEFTNLDYTYIVKAAIIPALLWFTAQFIVIHYESKKVGIMGVPRSQLQKLSDLLLKKGYLLLPVVAIVVVLSIGQSAMRAAVMGIFTALGMNIVALIIAYIIGKGDRLEYKLTIPLFFQILADAARVSLPVIAACAAAGIIGGVITLTGLGLKIAGGIVDLAQNNLLLTMFFTMIASIVLGMGLPTTANYVITATMAAPALLSFGDIPVIAAHLFVFYFGIVADITPPVALAAYAGAGLAKSNPFKTGLESVRIAIGGFLVPYMFVLSPVLVLENATLLSFSLALATSILGMFCIGTATVGFIEKRLMLVERIILAGAGLGLLHAQWTTDLFGLVVFAFMLGYQKISARKKEKMAAI